MAGSPGGVCVLPPTMGGQQLDKNLMLVWPQSFWKRT